MKNKGLIIIMIILLSIIVIGLIALLYFSISGKFNFGMRFSIGKRSDTIIYDENYELISINDIEVISSAGAVKFEESTDEKVRVVVYGQNDGKLKVNFNDNKLKIDYSDQSRNFFGSNLYLNDIIVYVPSNFDKNIKIDLAYGEVNVLNLENASIDINNNCGDINLGEIKNVKIKIDYGDIDIKKVLNKLDLKLDCGDLEIDELKLLDDSKIKADLGDVKIGKTNDIYIDSKVDLGDVKVNNSNRNAKVTLKVEVDCGNIKIDN